MNRIFQLKKHQNTVHGSFQETIIPWAQNYGQMVPESLKKSIEMNPREKYLKNACADNAKNSCHQILLKQINNNSIIDYTATSIFLYLETLCLFVFVCSFINLHYTVGFN